MCKENRNIIAPAEVRKDRYGFWTHPGYQAYFEGKIEVYDDDVAKFCDKFGVEITHSFMFDEVETPVVYDLDEAWVASNWQPKSPDGNGWFIVSIHDTEEGPVCIWSRQMSAVNRAEARWTTRRTHD